MSDALREVTVNGKRYFLAEDVERWHRQSVNLGDTVCDLEKRVCVLERVVEAANDLPLWRLEGDDAPEDEYQAVQRFRHALEGASNG